MVEESPPPPPPHDCKGLFTLNAKIRRECSVRLHFRIETIDPYGAFTPGAINCGAKKRGFFFHPVCRFFSPSLHKKTGRPIRSELRSRAWSSYCCTKRQEWWRCFENQSKQTQKKSILREKRVDAEFLLSLVSENLFILTCS